MRKRPTISEALKIKAKPLVAPSRPNLERLARKQYKRKPKDPHGFEQNVESAYQKEYRLLSDLIKVYKSGNDPLDGMYRLPEALVRREQVSRLMR